MKIDTSNLTVCISGYNIKENLILAIESFRYYNPGDYEVLVFDDCSTDGTREAMESLGCRVTTWTDHYIDVLNKFRDLYSEINLSARVSLINKQLFEAVTTQYALFIDGDTVTYKEGLLDWVLDFYLEGTSGIYLAEHIVLDKDYFSTFTHYPQLKEIISTSFDTDFTRRYHFYFSFVNRDFFLSRNISIESEDFLLLHAQAQGLVLETGSWTHHILKLHEENTLLFMYDKLNSYFFHFGWISSLQREFDTDYSTKTYFGRHFGSLLYSDMDRGYLKIQDKCMEISSYLTEDLRKKMFSVLKKLYKLRLTTTRTYNIIQD